LNFDSLNEVRVATKADSGGIFADLVGLIESFFLVAFVLITVVFFYSSDNF